MIAVVVVLGGSSAVDYVLDDAVYRYSVDLIDIPDFFLARL